MSTLAQVILEGLDASKPSAGIEGRLYFTTDTNKVYYDTGSAWTAVGPSGTGGGSYTLPAATSSALGGVELAAGQTSSTLSTVATTGAYSDLSGKPSIPAAQVNSDWNASSGVAQILNKPTLAPSATTDTTDASNITSGTLPAAQLPAPGATTLGGVQAISSTAHKYLTSISTSGVPAAVQPVSADLSDLGTASGAAVLSASGVLLATEMPAVSGDVVITAGTTSATVEGINGTNLAGLGAGLLKQNGSGVPALAVAGTDYAGLASTNAFSANQSLANNTAATSGANQSTPAQILSGNYWNGSASAVDSWTIQSVLGSGTNPTSFLTISHSGSSGTSQLQLSCGVNFAGGNTVTCRSTFQVITASTATSGANQSSPLFYLEASYWTGSTAAFDQWAIQSVMGTGSNPTTTLVFTHSGSTGAAAISVPHLIGNTSAPTVAAGTGAGTSPTISIQSGSTDMSGWANVTTGTSPTASATVATITFNKPFNVAAKVILTPANAAAAALTGNQQVYVPVPGGGTSFTINVGSTALAASTAYVWSYVVIG